MMAGTAALAVTDVSSNRDLKLKVLGFDWDPSTGGVRINDIKDIMSCFSLPEYRELASLFH